MHFFDAMHLFCAGIFLLICKVKSEVEPENATDVMERTDTYVHTPTDFRCFKHSLKDFNIRKDYPVIYYVSVLQSIIPDETIGCLNRAEVQKKNRFYPPLTGRDPMMVRGFLYLKSQAHFSTEKKKCQEKKEMPRRRGQEANELDKEFYIEQLYAGLQYVPTDNSYIFTSGSTPLTRRKQYCHDLIRIESAFPEYWETFHSDDETCLKMMGLIQDCHIFRQIRESYNSKLYEKLCLDEDGCYNVMEYYAEDLPYCVKYTALLQFKNASVGTWHHSIINYCHLREMVPEVKEAKYEPSILKGKSKGDLTKMCLYLRHRLLSEEGKETEMPDPDTLDYPDDTTTVEYGNGVPDVASFWTITFVITCFLCTPHKYNQGSSTN